MESNRRAFIRGALCTGLAAAVWVPAAPYAFSLPTAALFEGGPLPGWVDELLERHLAIWERHDTADLSLERSTNPEWDFMGRTFLVLALANLCLRRPEQAPRYLAVMDAAIADTVATEQSRSQYWYLMSYATAGPWRRRPERSVFVDGEIAAMLAAYELVSPGSRWRGPLRKRLGVLSREMRAGPTLSAESYPNECWTFCNTFALAAIRMGEAAGVSVDATLPDDWLAVAKERLVNRDTGLLVSSYTWDGGVLDGPEGSSIWMSSHNLLLVDRDFARDQYERGLERLGRQFLGFGYAMEWPAGHRGPMDVDSGPIVPLLQASPGSSGLALVGARAFDDRDYYDALVSSLQLAAFPERDNGELRYLASNQVGDAALLYAAVLGPLWDAVSPGVA